MKTKLLYTLMLLVSYLTAHSQAPGKEWDKRFGGSAIDEITSMQVTTDGGYLLGGISTSGVEGDKTEATRGGIDYWVVKTNSSGVKQWDKRFGGSSADNLYAVLSTSDGGYLLGGYSNSNAGGDKTQNSKGNNDYWVVKINSSGVKQWDATYGGSGQDALRSMLATSDGGYLLGGYSPSPISGDKTQATQGGDDYWVVKINGSGVKQWDARFGGSGADQLYSMVATSDGGYLLGGYSASGISGDKTEASRGGNDYWVVKINGSGVKQWDKRFGGSGSDQIYSLLSIDDGGYLLGGISSSGAGGDKTQGTQGYIDYWVVKINSSGTKQWDYRYGGNGSFAFNMFTSMTSTDDGGYLLGGYSDSNPAGGDKSEDSRGITDYWVVKIDDSGTKEWDATFGGDNYDDLYSVLQTSDGGYLLGGSSQSGITGDKTEASRGGKDFWVVKLEGSQKTITTGTISGSPFCAGSPVSVPYTVSSSFDAGNVFTAQLSDASGSFASPVNIGTLSATGNGTINATIPGSTPSGSGYRIRVVGSNPAVTGSDNSSDLTVNLIPQGSISSNGPFSGSGTGQLTWTSTSGTGPFTVIYNDGVADRTKTGAVSGTPFNVFTNPVTSTTTYTLVSVEDNNGCIRTTGFTDGSATIVVTGGACPDMIGGTASPIYSIICPTTTQNLSANGTGGTLQWQKSADNISWSDISGAISSNYTTPDGSTLGGAGTKIYYRCLVKNTGCHDVSSTTAIVDVSQPSITVTVSAKTDNSLTLNWSPTGNGNYDIAYDGASAGSVSGKTPPYTLSGLNSGGSYNITVTQTGVVGCSASGTLTGVNTLCAMPDNVAVSSPGNRKLKVDWEGAAGNYRVYYRPTFIRNGYQTKDVTTAGTSGSTTINVTYNTSYEVYVASKDCPSSGQFGQPSALYYGVVGVSSPCTPVPTIHYVKSTCAGQIEVSMSGSPTEKYTVAVQRMTPTVTSMNRYSVSGSYFSVNVNSAGETFLVAVASKCITGTSDYVVYSGGITIKPLCKSIPNLVLSHPTCNGFTASWNRDICSENTINTYQVFMRRISPSPQLTWNSYQIAPPVLPITPFMKVNWLNKGSLIQCYVRSNYVCNGYIIQGPPSTTESITTLSIGCREEDESLIQPEEPAAVITSPDNTEAISLYPNPNGGQFRIDISRLSNEKAEVRIEVMNMLGQTILTRISEAKDGFGNELITLPGTVSSGTYFVRVTVGNNLYTTKVNVSR